MLGSVDPVNKTVKDIEAFITFETEHTTGRVSITWVQDKHADFFKVYSPLQNSDCSKITCTSQSYVSTLELNLWNSTSVKEATWDASKKNWTVPLETHRHGFKETC